MLHRSFEMAVIRDGDKDLVAIWDVSSERIYKEATGDESEAVSYSCTSDVSMQTEAGSEDGAVSNITSNLTLENIVSELEGSKFIWRGYHAFEVKDPEKTTPPDVIKDAKVLIYNSEEKKLYHLRKNCCCSH